MAIQDRRPPELLRAGDLAEDDHGLLQWDGSHNGKILTVTNGGATIEWGPRKPENTAKYGPAFVPASTRARLHSGTFDLEFSVDEMASRQIGVGFALLWNVGIDWGFFGYLGASPSAFSYDPSTGDVVTNTASIENGLPKSSDGRTAVVGLHLELPRHKEGRARFTMNGVHAKDIALPEGAVVVPAACLLKETQRITLRRR